MRYQVVDGSESGHCCFEATVVDVQRPNPAHPNFFYQMCECFDINDAKLIAEALNGQPDAGGP